MAVQTVRWESVLWAVSRRRCIGNRSCGLSHSDRALGISLVGCFAALPHAVWASLPLSCCPYSLSASFPYGLVLLPLPLPIPASPCLAVHSILLGAWLS